MHYVPDLSTFIPPLALCFHPLLSLSLVIALFNAASSSTLPLVLFYSILFCYRIAMSIIHCHV